MPAQAPPTCSPRDLLLSAGLATVVLGVAMMAMGLRLEASVAHRVPHSHAAPPRVEATEPVWAGRLAVIAPPTGRAANEPAGCEAAATPRTFAATCTRRNEPGRDQRRDLAVMALWQRGYPREQPVGSLEQYPPDTWAATPSVAPYD